MARTCDFTQSLTRVARTCDFDKNLKFEIALTASILDGSGSSFHQWLGSPGTPIPEQLGPIGKLFFRAHFEILVGSDLTFYYIWKAWQEWKEIWKNALIRQSFDRLGCNFHLVAHTFFKLAIFLGHLASPGLRVNGLQISKLAKKKKSVVFYLYMGVVEVEQNGVSDNLDTFQLRPEDWFTICMKLVPLSREWRQLRPQPSGLFTA